MKDKAGTSSCPTCIRGSCRISEFWEQSEEHCKVVSVQTAPREEPGCVVMICFWWSTAHEQSRTFSCPVNSSLTCSLWTAHEQPHSFCQWRVNKVWKQCLWVNSSWREQQHLVANSSWTCGLVNSSWTVLQIQWTVHKLCSSWVVKSPWPNMFSSEHLSWALP